MNQNQNSCPEEKQYPEVNLNFITWQTGPFNIKGPVLPAVYVRKTFHAEPMCFLIPVKNFILGMPKIYIL